MSNKNILIIYASNSGSTMLTANLIGGVLLHNLYAVTIKHATKVTADDIADATVILFGSPSWKVNSIEGQPHETMTELFARLQNTSLANKTIALFGCGDTAYTNFCGAVDHMEEFVHALHGTLCTEPLRVDSFYFDIKRNKTLIEKWAKKLALHLKK